MWIPRRRHKAFAGKASRTVAKARMGLHWAARGHCTQREMQMGSVPVPEGGGRGLDPCVREEVVSLREEVVV